MAWADLMEWSGGGRFRRHRSRWPSSSIECSDRHSSPSNVLVGFEEQRDLLTAGAVPTTGRRCAGIAVCGHVLSTAQARMLSRLQRERQGNGRVTGSQAERDQSAGYVPPTPIHRIRSETGPQALHVILTKRHPLITYRASGASVRTSHAAPDRLDRGLQLVLVAVEAITVSGVDGLCRIDGVDVSVHSPARPATSPSTEGIAQLEWFGRSWPLESDWVAVRGR